MWQQQLFPGSMDGHKANTLFCVSHPYNFAGFCDCIASVCVSIDMPEHSIGRIPLVHYGVHNRPRLNYYVCDKNTAKGWWYVFEHVISAIYKTTEGNILLINCSFKAQETYGRTSVLSLTYLRCFSCNSLWIRHKLLTGIECKWLLFCIDMTWQ